MAEILTILTVDASTGITTERELNVEELELKALVQTEFEAQELAKEAKAAARESALAKLADLGLTAEEIAAL